jgi:hypothetical protein
MLAINRATGTDWILALTWFWLVLQFKTSTAEACVWEKSSVTATASRQIQR